MRNTSAVTNIDYLLPALRAKKVVYSYNGSWWPSRWNVLLWKLKCLLWNICDFFHSVNTTLCSVMNLKPKAFMVQKNSNRFLDKINKTPYLKTTITNYMPIIYIFFNIFYSIKFNNKIWIIILYNVKSRIKTEE